MYGSTQVSIQASTVLCLVQGTSPHDYDKVVGSLMELPWGLAMVLLPDASSPASFTHANFIMRVPTWKWRCSYNEQVIPTVVSSCAEEVLQRAVVSKATAIQRVASFLLARVRSFGNG